MHRVERMYRKIIDKLVIDADTEDLHCQLQLARVCFQLQKYASCIESLEPLRDPEFGDEGVPT